jgi:carbamate kinase
VRIVIALGGNALLKRGQTLSAANQLENIRVAATQIGKIAAGNELVITHGNGPQIGLLALQSAAYTQVPSYPLDVLNAETEGMIGYMLEQELANQLPVSRPIATLLTRVQVNPHDPAFQTPSKPIGPMYSQAEAERIAKERGWMIAPDANGYRRVVASPQPIRIVELQPIRWLLEKHTVVICAGGGGIPISTSTDDSSCVSSEFDKSVGIEAVVDKDFVSALLAKDIAADRLIIATDVAAVYVDWGKTTQRAIRSISAMALREFRFTAGSMGPKVLAACRFVEASGKDATIGALADIEALLEGSAGTTVSINCGSTEYT